MGANMTNWIWQDYILAIGSFLLSIALIPSLISPNKPHWHTSLLTTVVLAAFCLVYATLEMDLALISGIIVTAMWLALFLQVIFKRPNGTK